MSDNSDKSVNFAAVRKSPVIDLNDLLVPVPPATEASLGAGPSVPVYTPTADRVATTTEAAELQVEPQAKKTKKSKKCIVM